MFDVELLTQPASAVFPKDWLNQKAATGYCSYSDAKTFLDTQDLDIKQMKPILEGHLFLSDQASPVAEFHPMFDMFPQLEEGPMGTVSSRLRTAEQVSKYAGQTSTKKISEVGTAILL